MDISSLSNNEQLKQLDSKIAECHIEYTKLNNKLMYYKYELDKCNDKLNEYKNEYLKLMKSDDNFNICIQCRKYKSTTAIANKKSHTFCKECCIERGYCFECGNDNLYYKCRCR
jgi:chromosome segregation ATPase